MSHEAVEAVVVEVEVGEMDDRSHDDEVDNRTSRVENAKVLPSLDGDACVLNANDGNLGMRVHRRRLHLDHC